MSVTRLLRDETSWLYQFLQEKVSTTAAYRFIDTANNMLPEPSGAPEGVDYLLSGMAFTYAFRFWVDPSSWLDTVGHRGAATIGADGLVSYLVESLGVNGLQLGDPSWNYRLAMASCIMAKFDSHRRGRKIPDGINLLSGSGLESATTKLGISLASVRDVANLAPTISEAWTTTNLSRPTELQSNPSFYWSKACGGGDAQMIVGGSLIEIKTSTRNRPLDITSFFQQIAYYLMDKDDEYAIQRITWYWSRHKAMLSVPIGKLIKDPVQLRKDFSEAAEEEESSPPNPFEDDDPILDRIWKNWQYDAWNGDWAW